MESLTIIMLLKCINKYHEELEKKPHILITTIAQIESYTSKGKPKMSLKNLKYLILDECDCVMANDKAKAFLPQLILRKMPTTTKIIFISATLTQTARDIIEKMQEKRTFVESLTPVEQLT